MSQEILVPCGTQNNDKNYPVIETREPSTDALIKVTDNDSFIVFPQSTPVASPSIGKVATNRYMW